MTPARGAADADPRAVALRAIDALNAGDADGFVACLHEDVAWEVVGGDFLPNGARYEGKRDYVERLVPLGVFDPGSLRIDVRNVFVEGDTAVVEWIANATSGGRPYLDSSYCLVLRIADGLIREARQYFDTRKVQRELYPDG